MLLSSVWLFRAAIADRVVVHQILSFTLVLIRCIVARFRAEPLLGLSTAVAERVVASNANGRSTARVGAFRIAA